MEGRPAGINYQSFCNPNLEYCFFFAQQQAPLFGTPQFPCEGVERLHHKISDNKPAWTGRAAKPDPPIDGELANWAR